jgi:hypothetical protein
MQQLIEFMGHHPFLAGAAAVAFVIVALYEIRTGVQTSLALSANQAVRLMNQGALVICAARIRTTPDTLARRATSPLPRWNPRPIP